MAAGKSLPLEMQDEESSYRIFILKIISQLHLPPFSCVYDIDDDMQREKYLKGAAYELLPR